MKPARELEIHHSYAQVNGIRLHYAECGSSTDLVILLHGFPEFWYSWRHQLRALGKHFHVIAPDMRGYNLSDKPAHVEDYRIEVLVEDVIALIKHFGAGKAAVVGHDWGGAVAWAAAQKHPEHISKLAVLQIPPTAAWRANITIRQLLRSWYMLFFQLPRVPEWAIARNNFAGLNKIFTEKVVQAESFTEHDIAMYKEAMRQPGALTAAINYYRANVGRLLSRKKIHAGPKRYGRIRVPTLFIFAERDFAIIPETVRGVVNYVNAPYREVRIPKSGHWVQNEAITEVNDALMGFLATS